MIKSRKNMRSSPAIGALFLACGSVAGDDEESGVIQQDIRNGITSNHRGVVEVQTAGGVCTGAMIGPWYVITAAHCYDKPSFVGHDDFAETTIWYFDPELPGGKRRVSPVRQSMRVMMIETYTRGHTDFQDDIALVYNGGYEAGETWFDTHDSDYLRINGGHAGGSIYDIGQIWVYGRGPNSEDGTGSGTLRKAAVTPSSVGKHHFTDLGGARGLCRGDSGGPHIGKRPSEEPGGGMVDVLAGVHSSSQKVGGFLCSGPGHEQHAARTNSRTDWIISKVGFSCTKKAQYMKCF